MKHMGKTIIYFGLIFLVSCTFNKGENINNDKTEENNLIIIEQEITDKLASDKWLTEQAAADKLASDKWLAEQVAADKLASDKWLAEQEKK